MATIALWKDKDKQLLDPRLFSERAEKFASKIGDEGRKDDDGKSVVESKFRNKNSQVRRFFDEINRLNSQAQLVSNCIS